MIIKCKSCAKKFIVRDTDIPKSGRMVQCGYCSVTWHQMPTSIPLAGSKQKSTTKLAKRKNDDLFVGAVKASDGKTYKFLGAQWAVLFPSGKTGLFAKKKIGKELDRLTGRKIEISVENKRKKIEEVDPSSESLYDEKKLPNIYKPKKGLGFFGFIFLLIVIIFSIVGVLKIFESDLINYFPETGYVYKLLNQQLEYFYETFNNIIIIIKDLIKSY